MLKKWFITTKMCLLVSETYLQAVLYYLLAIC